MQKTEIPEDKNIKLISMHDEMSSSYLSYAMSVIVSRALPDIRDGLKPVHRRILYASTKVDMIGQNNLENLQELLEMLLVSITRMEISQFMML